MLPAGGPRSARPARTPQPPLPSLGSPTSPLHKGCSLDAADTMESDPGTSCCCGSTLLGQACSRDNHAPIGTSTMAPTEHLVPPARAVSGHLQQPPTLSPCAAAAPRAPSAPRGRLWEPRVAKQGACCNTSAAAKS